MSAPKANPYDGLTKAAFDALGWPALIAGCSRKECGIYQEAFRDKAKELEQASQTEAASAARALSQLPKRL